MTRDEALRDAGRIIISVFDDTFGSVTFNLQGLRPTVHANTEENLCIEIDGKEIPVTIKNTYSENKSKP